MKYVAFGKICKLQNGKPFNSSEWSEKGLPIVRIQNLTDESKPFNYCDIEIDSRFHIKSGDLLFSWSGTPGSSFGSFFWERGRALLNQHIFRVDVEEKNVNKKYLRLAINSRLNEIIDQAHGGVGLKHITKRKLEAIRVPLPSVNDQIRIAALLSKVESLIAKRKKSIADLDELLKSTFLEMFGDPVRNEMGWEKKTAIDYSNCIVPGRDKPKSFSGDTPWVTTNDINHLGYTEKSKSEIGLNDKEILRVKAKRIPKDSVVLVCAGDLGRVTILRQEVVINQQLHSFQVNLYMNGFFFMFAISFQKGFMYRRATKTTIPYMNKTVCNSIPVINPPFTLQNQFATIVEKVETLKEKCQNSLNDLETLYGALSQKAFKGELDLSRIPIVVESAPKDITTAEPQVGKPEITLQDEPMKTSETREQILHRLFNGFISDVKNGALSLDDFWQKAEETFMDLMDEDAPPLGVDDYDRVRDWLFDMLAQGKVDQVFNEQENRMEIRSVS